MMARLLPRVALALLLSVAPVAVTGARAVDASNTSLQIELTDEIAARLLETYNNAIYAPSGFETFELLFQGFETLRKWQAYLEAIEAAKLEKLSAPYEQLKATVDRLAAASVTEHSLADAAISSLRGLGNWHADDQAQADIVIEHLGELVTELNDPRLRVIGQTLLAEVELDSEAPLAAAERIVAAVPDLKQLESGREQLDFAVQLAMMVQTLDTPQAIEVTSEIAANVADPADRARFVRTLVQYMAPNVRARIAKAVADPGSTKDPLASAWASHVGGVNADSAAVAQRLGGAIDPLPVLIALAHGVTPEARQDVCRTLVKQQVENGSALRALNLRRTLGSADCTPDTAALLAEHFARTGYPQLAQPLAGEVLETAAADAALLVRAAGVLEATGDVAQLMARASQLPRGTDLKAVAGRAAIQAMLLDRALAKTALTGDMAAAVSGYAPATAMYGLLVGTSEGAELAGAVSVADLALARQVGVALAERAGGGQRFENFMDAAAPAELRLALAAGFTGHRNFNADASERLAQSLSTLAQSDAATDRDSVLVRASLGNLEAGSADDETLVRAARQLAWRGDVAGATAAVAQLANVTTAEDLRVDLAAIAAVVGDFDTGVASLRVIEATPERVAAFRFVARERARRLDVHGWIEGGAMLDLEPVQLVNASTGDGPVIHYNERVNVRASGAPLPSGRPVLPDLDVTGSDVRRLVPTPTGGAGGIVVGGEGRYVRLGGFDSPYFDGESNNGVRDYVYEQNKTITPEFIFLNEGVFTLADVIAAIGRDEADAIDVLADGVVRLNRPLAIGSEATLILSNEEVRELQLNSTTGAFLVNAGHLYVSGVRVVGFDVEKNAIPLRGYETAMHKFRPFLLSWSGSETNLADSEFVALGYSAGRSYGLTFNSGPVDDYYDRAAPVAPTGIVVDNSFDNIFYGFYAYEASDIQLVGNEYRDNIIYGIDPHDRSVRLNISLNTAYATIKKHGIIISREVNDSFIVANMSFDNYGSGTMLDRSSLGTLVFANTLRGNHGDGLAVFESPCTIVGMNDVSGNNRAGIKVRNSWDVLLLQNVVTDNKGTAIEGFISDLSQSEGSAGRDFVLDPYQPVASFAAVGNVVRGNGAGIQTAGVSAIELYGNQFRNQSGRLVAGDLDGLQGLLLQQAGRQPTVVSTNCVPVLQPIHACHFSGAGLLGATRFSTSASGDACTTDASNAQAQAFSMVAK